MDAPHIPVLLAESLEALAIRPDGTYVDATFGAGGHSRAILAQLSATGRLFAVDADPSARARTPQDPRFTLIHANFRDLSAILAQAGVTAVDGVLFDLGVSSMQFDEGERGFSFREDAPLDMRMDPTQGETAAELLARVSETELADLIYTLGEERASRRIARAIVRRREEARPPVTTGDLARLVAAVMHRPGKRERIHPATRTFQALRLAVNDELGALRDGLASAIASTRPGGRLAVISFHSLEDRIVKLAFREDERVRPVVRKPIVAGETELAANPRARSAKLRVAERLEAAA